MKLGVVVIGRNDGYKDIERGVIHFKSLLETFDEITYVDWNSPTGSYFWELRDQLPKTGKIKHIIIPKEAIEQIPGAQLCNESLSRNIGIRRSEADWIVSTNLDIIAPTRFDLLNTINQLDPNGFYTISRREAPKELIYTGNLREKLADIPERRFMAKVTPTDHYSLINCCGDFQLAHRNVWNKIKGFEESMIYACFIDSNIQKKAVLNGCPLKALFEPGVYHMEHGSYYTKEDGTRSSDKGKYEGDNKAYNSAWDYVEIFEKSTNDDNWGWNDVEIEHEIY